MSRFLLPLLIALPLAACATPPAPLAPAKATEAIDASAADRAAERSLSAALEAAEPAVTKARTVSEAEKIALAAVRQALGRTPAQVQAQTRLLADKGLLVQLQAQAVTDQAKGIQAQHQWVLRPFPAH